jgi:carbamate kinase
MRVVLALGGNALLKRGEPLDAEVRRLSFAPGSMGPKVEAACRFVETTGRMAAIGAIEDAAQILAGKAGTIISTARA